MTIQEAIQKLETAKRDQTPETQQEIDLIIERLKKDD